MSITEQITAHLRALAVRDLGDAQAEKSVQAVLDIVRQMLAGADWYGRPAGRRSDYSAAAAAARRLDTSLSK